MQNLPHFSAAKDKLHIFASLTLTVTCLLDQIQNSENEMLEAHSMLGWEMKTPPKKNDTEKARKGESEVGWDGVTVVGERGELEYLWEYN